MYGDYTLHTMDYIIIALMMVVPLSLVLIKAYKDSRKPTIHDCTMAEYRRMTNYTGGVHDGSVEYVLTNNQIKELVKPVLFDQDGYFPNTKSEEDYQ